MLFREKRCIHKWRIFGKSNALQTDHDGYPLRLCIMECDYCGDTRQNWIDVPLEETKELETGESFLVEWKLRREETVITYE